MRVRARRAGLADAGVSTASAWRRHERLLTLDPHVRSHARSAATPALLARETEGVVALACSEDATESFADDPSSAAAPGARYPPSAAAWMGGVPYNPVLLERFRQTAALEGRTRHCAVRRCAARARTAADA